MWSLLVIIFNSINLKTKKTNQNASLLQLNAHNHSYTSYLYLLREMLHITLPGIRIGCHSG